MNQTASYQTQVTALTGADFCFSQFYGSLKVSPELFFDMLQHKAVKPRAIK